MASTDIILQDHIIDQHYSDYVQPYNQNIFEIINYHLGDIDPLWHSKQILDFGCNVGHLLGYSNGKITNYTGVDVQNKPLSIAKEKYPNGRWVYYDGYHPAFNSNGTELFPELADKYDYIFCIGVFTHCDLDQIDYLISKFKNHLRHSGRILFSLWERSSWPLYTKIFLLEKFGIKLDDSVFKDFHQSIYLLDRKESIVDTRHLPLKKYTWIETFYDRNFMLDHIPGSGVLEGIYTKHTIYMI